MALYCASAKQPKEVLYMFNSKSVSRLLSIFFLGLVIAVVASCGSGGSTDTTNTTTGTGSVALLLTDAPSDIFEEINITVVKAELLSDDGRVTIFKGERTFNLLDLTDVKIFAIRDGVPAGTYNKIRLTLTDIELVDYDENFTVHPKLPGNGKLDLNPRGDFTVVAGGTLAIQIDMDANKSIHIVKTGKKDKYQFRPVVFIDIVTDAFEERFVKLHGDIYAIDTLDLSFKLCNTDIPVQTDDDQMKASSRGCVRVETDKTTSIFDINGPATFSDLVEGEPATVFGRLLRDTDYDHDSDKDGDREDDREMDDLVLKAALIELGPETAFLKLNGTATSTVDINDQFTMDVAPGQGLTTPLILTVQIQDGTLLIDRKGNPVKITEIYNGKLVSVRGVLDVNTDTLFASVILVDTDSSEQLTGIIGLNPDGNCGFTITDDVVGDRSVATDSNTKVFLVIDGNSSPINVSELYAGQSADVYGISNSATSCFDAHTIIAY